MAHGKQCSLDVIITDNIIDNNIKSKIRLFYKPTYWYLLYLNTLYSALAVFHEFVVINHVINLTGFCFFFPIPPRNGLWYEVHIDSRFSVLGPVV